MASISSENELREMYESLSKEQLLSLLIEKTKENKKDILSFRDKRAGSKTPI